MCDWTHSLIDFLLARQSFQQLSGRNPVCPSLGFSFLRPRFLWSPWLVPQYSLFEASRRGTQDSPRLWHFCALAYLSAGVPAYVKALCPSYGSASLVSEFSHHGACSGVAGIWRVARVSFYDHDALGITGDLRARLRHLA